MKIQRPEGPAPTADVELERTDEAGPARGASAAPAANVDGPSEPSRTAFADPVAAIARDLRTGAITAEQAIDRVIEAAAQRGAAARAPESVRRAIRAQLDELMREDPSLASRAKRLGADLD